MYTMMLVAALAAGMDTPDLGHRRGGGCSGCYGGACYGGWGGCYGGGWGGCYGGGGGCYGGGGGWYGGPVRGHVWGGGYGGPYAWNGGYPGTYAWGGYTYSPLIYDSNFNTPMVAGNRYGDSNARQSYYFNPGSNQGSEAMIVVHLPPDAKLTIDEQPTQSTSGMRVFTSPPLEPGKTYHYTLRAKVNRDGRTFDAKKTVKVQAGRTSEVTLDFPELNRDRERLNPPEPADRENPSQPPVPPEDRNKPKTPREPKPPQSL